ncbi:coiled-coil domain-containing protein 40 [Silurus meridionalis]|uniref:coiled-coil domain-containing protein 40 n=1 Tax=Silurus meridionalis TaxID=175797 RepID=UPI001EE9B967|nr:coiled-coil domain-containing protein 40 [Silurus meridionalis]
MKRAVKPKDEEWGESPHDEEEPEEREEPEDGAEGPSDIRVSQQERSTERDESSTDLSHTHTPASIITHTHSEQDSGSVPEPPSSSLYLTLADHNAAALAESEDEERTRLSHDDDDAGDDGDDGDEDEDELIVLDPEHPLMTRVQEAVKKLFTRQMEILDLKLREEVMEQRVQMSGHEDLGVRLYSAQQDLSRLQVLLDDQHESSNEAIRDRSHIQDQVENIRNQYNNTTAQNNKQRTQVSELQSEMEVLALRQLYMQEMTSDLRSDVAAVKKAKNRAQAEKRRVEHQKHQQDLYVDRLTRQVEKLRENIALLQVQMQAQSNDRGASGDALAETQLEIDSMAVERKQLLQQWNSCLKEIKSEDEVYAQLQESLRSANHEVRALETEGEGYRRSITQEQERNESLTVQGNRAESNCATYRKLDSNAATKLEALQNLYTTNTRMLQEIERTLTRVTTDQSAHQSALTVLGKQLEKEAFTRLELEEKIMRKMQEQHTHDNTAKHTHHLSTKTMALQRENDAQISKVENELALLALEASDVELQVEALSSLQLEQEQEVMKRNQLLSTNEAAMAKLIFTIERKQVTINTWKKKIEQIRASTGQEDLGPLEIEVRTLSKKLEELEAEMKEQRHFWLWQQGELVSLSQEKHAENSAKLMLNTKLTILQQRKLRTKGECEQEERGLAEMERHFDVLRLDMQKLSALVNQNTQLKEQLEKNNILMENSFIHTFKDANKKSVETQLHLEKIQEEKEQSLNSLVEAERQIMLWEKKIQLAHETRSAVDSESGKGDINTMKTEIHRMEGYCSQLLKQQEKMLREMEAAVARTENIAARSDALASSDRKPSTHSSLQNTLHNLRREIIQSHKQAGEYDALIALLQQEQNSLTETLREKRMQITELNKTISSQTDDLSNMQDIKQKNLFQLLTLQSRVKQLQAVRDGRYSPWASGEQALQLATHTMQQELRSIRDVLLHIIQDFPDHKALLHRINLMISTHTDSAQGRN